MYLLLAYINDHTKHLGLSAALVANKLVIRMDNRQISNPFKNKIEQSTTQHLSILQALEIKSKCSKDVYTITRKHTERMKIDGYILEKGTVASLSWSHIG